MQPHARLANLIEYSIFAATTLKEIAQSAQVPYLLSASLTLMILEFVSASKATKELTVQMIEQIHEILCAIIGLYSSTAMDRILPPEVLYDIVTFIETLQKIYTFMKGQQEMGKIRQLFKQGTSTAQLEACRAGLQEALTAFRVQISVSTLSGMAQARKDVEQQHEELVALLAANLDITRSDSSSAGTGTIPSVGSSVESLALLPASPQIFHGRESELEDLRGILAQDYARIAILGPGGMGKTTLALSLLHEPSTVSKYVHRYFVPCHSIPTCSELVSNIASHIGVDQGRNLARRIGRHLSLNPPSLLILDNLETPWEPLSSRADVEELLSLLVDVSHLAIVITMRGAERPGKVKWTRPCPLPLQPLSAAPALQTFMDIAGGSHDEAIVQQLIDLTGNSPWRHSDSNLARRTEYPEARRINASAAASSNLPNFATAWAYLNVALIDSAIGADPNLIRRNVDIATDQFGTSLAFPLGASLCNVVYADLHLREGNPALA
ncbi:hypothetical protein B0H13DRAFT_2311777 [Mycena leptocephala]|nr:hypothetical protein B0H13DRAFT_2311777 [Mycena leptocephala]